jgi:hypothetical protein
MCHHLGEIDVVVQISHRTPHRPIEGTISAIVGGYSPYRSENISIGNGEQFADQGDRR